LQQLWPYVAGVVSFFLLQSFIVSYEEKINTLLTRRGRKMSQAYLFGLITEDIAESNTRDL